MAALAWIPETGYGNVYVDSLIGGNYKWNLATGPVTYAFGPAGQWSDGLTTLAWTDAEKGLFHSVFAACSAVCGLRFAEVDYSAGANLVERKLAQISPDGLVLGLHDVPYPRGGNSPAVLTGQFSTSTEYWSLTPGSTGHATVLHEIGHALNLAHPHDGGWGYSPSVFPGVTEPYESYGDDGLNQGIWTVMTYNHGWINQSGPLPGNYGDVITPMALDIAALQAMYGANDTYRTGDDIYQLPYANGVGTGWSCIWDAGGSDTISNAGSTRSCTISLLAATLAGENAGGSVSWNGGIAGGYTIANGVVIENAVGGAGNDAITGNRANNRLQGGSGNDSLIGGPGDDTIAGGDGADYVDFVDSRSAYAIEYADGVYTITGAEGADKVSGIEYFRFGDGLFSVSTLIAYAATGGVSIGGTPVQGQTLSAAHTLADLNGLGPISYQWLRAQTAIAGATGASYTLTQNDVGHSISVTASYTDGIRTLESVTSAATNAIANINDLPTGNVSISGTTTQGQTLRAMNTLSDPDGLGAIHYQWLRAGSLIGADVDSYVLTQADVGKSITVTASYTDGCGTRDSVTSAATSAVANVNDAPAGSVTISGIPFPGRILSAAQSLSDADGLGVIGYQWQLDGVDIAGATGASLSVPAARAGAAIAVTAKYIDGMGTGESVTSAVTNVVAVAETLMTKTTYAGSSHPDWVTGTGGNDSIKGYGGDDTLNGGPGDDRITAGAGNNAVNGGEGNDFIMQDETGSWDTMSGGPGVDTLDYSQMLLRSSQSVQLNYDLYVNLGTGKAYKFENDVHVGTDTLSEFEGIVGSRYRDRITGSARAEQISGGAGDDLLYGGAGNDTLNGGAGSDFQRGDAGDDALYGQEGNDTLSGSAGNNTLNGGAGNDLLGDDEGSNTYVFEASFGRDTLANWRDRSYVDDLDIVRFNGIGAERLFFQREGSDLKITVAGKTDMLRIVQWYGAASEADGPVQFQIDQFQAGDALLQGSVINELVTLVGAAPVSMTSLMA